MHNVFDLRMKSLVLVPKAKSQAEPHYRVERG